MQAEKMAPTTDAPAVSYSQPSDAQRLRDLLTRLGESQRGAARLLGVTDRTLRYWCSGKETPPSMAFLALERLIDIQRSVSDRGTG